MVKTISIILVIEVLVNPLVLLHENVRWLVVHFYDSVAELIIFGLVKNLRLGASHLLTAPVAIIS